MSIVCWVVRSRKWECMATERRFAGSHRNAGLSPIDPGVVAKLTIYWQPDGNAYT
jgi:hypothetical protein